MKAAYLVKPDKFEIRNVPIPKVKAGEVLIRVLGCAICGTDLRIFQYGHAKIKLPAVIGHEIVGIIEDVDTGVRKKIEPIIVGSKVMVTPGIPCMKCNNCLQGLFCTNKKAIGYHYP